MKTVERVLIFIAFSATVCAGNVDEASVLLAIDFTTVKLISNLQGELARLRNVIRSSLPGFENEIESLLILLEDYTTLKLASRIGVQHHLLEEFKVQMESARTHYRMGPMIILGEGRQLDECSDIGSDKCNEHLKSCEVSIEGANRTLKKLLTQVKETLAQRLSSDANNLQRTDRQSWIETLEFLSKNPGLGEDDEIDVDEIDVDEDSSVGFSNDFSDLASNKLQDLTFNIDRLNEVVLCFVESDAEPLDSTDFDSDAEPLDSTDFN